MRSSGTQGEISQQVLKHGEGNVSLRAHHSDTTPPLPAFHGIEMGI